MSNSDKVNPPKPVNPIELFTRMRSSRVKKVGLIAPGQEMAGATVNGTDVYVPYDDNAFGRFTRSHEVLHVQHTPKREKMADMLDQGLEDCRLHRYFSKALETEKSLGMSQSRQDEIAFAINDLQNIIEHVQPGKAQPIHSLMAMRAIALLHGSDNPLVTLASAKLGGKKFIENANRAIASLERSGGKHDSIEWQSARGEMADYFRENFTGKEPEPEPPIGDNPNPEPQEPQEPEEDEPWEEVGAPEPGEPQDGGTVFDDPKKQKPEPEEKPEPSSEPGQEPGEPQEQKPGDSQRVDTSEPEESPEPEKPVTSAPGMGVAPIAPVQVPKKYRPAKPRDINEYQGELAPEFDKYSFNRMQERCPQVMYIRRLDTGVNSVRLTLGKKEMRPSLTGSKINLRKLVQSMIQPGVRVFEKPGSQGGAGSILIDASGSMSLTDEILQGFLERAPLSTIAFYNGNARRSGNLYVYACDGRRAAKLNLADLEKGIINGIDLGAIARYGGNNLIDAQAMAWLIKQPEPRFYITDLGFTGPWAWYATSFFHKCLERKLFTQMPDIESMQCTLDKKPIPTCSHGNRPNACVYCRLGF